MKLNTDIQKLDTLLGPASRTNLPSCEAKAIVSKMKAEEVFAHIRHGYSYDSKMDAMMGINSHLLHLYNFVRDYDAALKITVPIEPGKSEYLACKLVIEWNGKKHECNGEIRNQTDCTIYDLPLSAFARDRGITLEGLINSQLLDQDYWDYYHIG
jgi:hypothetical protein